MRLEYTTSVTRILLAAVHVQNPFDSRHSPDLSARTPAKAADTEVDRRKRVDERVAQALEFAKEEAERQRQDRVRNAESGAKFMAYSLNSVRSRETSRNGEEAALFDGMAWSSSRMAAINRLAVHTGSDSNSISGQASSRQGGETATFNFTGTVGKGVGRGPDYEDARPAETSQSGYQGTNYRLTTGNGDDVLNVQLAAKLGESAGTASRVVNGQLFTGGGNDTVSLNAQGHDTSFLISAGVGDDTVAITSQSRSGVVDGGSGNDHIVYAGTATDADAPQSVTISGGAGDDTLVLSGALNADISGGSGADTIDIRNVFGRAFLGDLGDDHIRANSDTTLLLGDISGATQVDMVGETQTGEVRFASLQRDQVNITSNGKSVTITERSSGASLTFNGVAANFTSQLRFCPPPPPPSPPPPKETAVPQIETPATTVTTVATQASAQAGKAGGTAASGGSLAGAGSVSSAAGAQATSTGQAAAAASVKIVNARGKPLELQSQLQATALNVKV